MSTTIKRLGAGLAAVALLGLVAPGAAAQQELQSTGVYVNAGGNGSTRTNVSINGNELTVRIEATGVAASLVHAQHIHGEAGTVGECPTLGTDPDGDGFLSTAEGVAQYGTVKVSLTESGDTSADSALAVDRFPVAGDDGSYVYERTIEVDPDVAAEIENWVVIVHGVDADGSGAYDGDLKSSLTDDLPLEATMPATCGTFDVAQVSTTPTGSVAAGAGGTADGGLSGTWLLLGLVVAGSSLALGIARVARRPA